MGSFGGDRRGVSEVVGYVLSVAIVAMLMVGVVSSAGAYFQQRHAVSVSNELEIQGQQLARTIGVVDRLVRQSDSSGAIGRTVELPDRVGEERYRVRLVNRSRAARSGSPCDRPCLTLSTEAVTQRVYLRTVTPLRAGTVQGQQVYVVRPSETAAIELRSRD